MLIPFLENSENTASLYAHIYLSNLLEPRKVIFSDFGGQDREIEGGCGGSPIRNKKKGVEGVEIREWWA